jgi:hypothetical protein
LTKIIAYHDKKTDYFICNKCEHKTKDQGDYNRHLRTDKHKMSKTEYEAHMKKSYAGRKKIGDDVELLLYEILKQLDFEEILYSASSGNKFDFFIRYGNELFYRGIQVKTLTIPNKVSCKLKMRDKVYKNDTLIIGINSQNTRFMSIFYGEIVTKSQTFQLDNNILFDNVELFKVKLYEQCKRSTAVYENEINNYLSGTAKKEAESLKRFEEKCKALDENIEFKRYDTMYSPIDAICNGFKLQFKASSIKSNINTDLYSFSLSKKENGISRPYHKDDGIDYFCFEIVNDLYKDKFFIIPTSSLIEANHISDNTKIGKFGILLPIPTSKKYHWAIQFLNKFNFLKNMKIDTKNNNDEKIDTKNNNDEKIYTKNSNDEKINISSFNTEIIRKNIKNSVLDDSQILAFSNLHKKFIKLKYECEFDRKNKIISVNNNKIKVFSTKKSVSTAAVFTISYTKNSKQNCYHIEDGYDFFIFEFLMDKYINYCCIIPIQKLLFEGYISTNLKVGKKSINISFPDMMNKNWTGEYINKFDLLQ